MRGLLPCPKELNNLGKATVISASLERHEAYRNVEKVSLLRIKSAVAALSKHFVQACFDGIQLVADV